MRTARSPLRAVAVPSEHGGWGLTAEPVLLGLIVAPSAAGACLGAAACFLLPAYYVNPQVGGGFVLVAFTIVVLGGMGSFVGALVGGFLIGIVESLGGLYLGESLGQIGIFVIFIAVVLFKPEGLFGARA